MGKVKRGYCTMGLNPENLKIYLISKNTLGRIQVNEIGYDQRNDPYKTWIYIGATEDTLILREKVANKYYKGIENLVKMLESGEIRLEDIIKKVKSKNKVLLGGKNAD